jgi:hypothetical protein
MSTEKNPIEFNRGNKAINVTTLHGGERGGIIQLTQGIGGLPGGAKQPGFIQLTPKQAADTIARLTDWLVERGEA